MPVARSPQGPNLRTPVYVKEVMLTHYKRGESETARMASGDR